MSELIFTKGFPSQSKRDTVGRTPFMAKTNTVTIGIGGNLGDVKKRFFHLLRSLKKSPFFSSVSTSPILKNPPFGFLDQPDFHNAVVCLKTNIGYLKFYTIMRYLESRFGRIRSFKNAPRTLDIDIIFFGSLKLNLKNLTIPHPKWKERECVVVPLSFLEVCP